MRFLACRSAALLVLLLSTTSWFAQRAQLEPLLRESPARFIEESLKLASAKDIRTEEAVQLLARAASAARFVVKNPRQAIDIYGRANALHKTEFPQAGGYAYAEEIADIQQFDLNDRAAAAATLEELRKLYATSPAGGESAAWFVWKAKWLDAEIAWLRSGKKFDGAIDATAMTGFIPQIYYGAGTVAMVAGTLDPAINPFDPREVPPEELEKKLSAIAPSHSTFLWTWMFAIRLPTTAAVRHWLERNDPAGYWSASMLTLAAVAERDLEPDANPQFNVVAALIRSEEGKPTALALLAREYAKTHKLPPPMKLSIGH